MTRRYSKEFYVEGVLFWVAEDRPGDFVLRVRQHPRYDPACGLGMDLMKTIDTFGSAEIAEAAAYAQRAGTTDEVVR